MAQLDIEVGRGLRIPWEEIRESASRSSGPGGQHVNKSATRVTLRWNIQSSSTVAERVRMILVERLASRLTREGDLIVHADGFRSRARNLDAARVRLAEIVADALDVPRSRRATRPTQGSRTRHREAKQQRSGLKKSRRLRGDPDD
ncbi:MAG: alternative ribosome rescue aminoacyl-tRNA hydrolase ArfB [Myxococcota bacterium]|nr:alternative ribosome rescue aminoacyl-tRNA hydrolase ArfB [Myxococcota bacterium]